MYKIAQFTQKKSQISLFRKFSDNLNVISSHFSFQKTPKTGKNERTNKLAFYASFYLLGTWSWFLMVSNCSLATSHFLNKPITIIYIFSEDMWRENYCILACNVLYFLLLETNILTNEFVKMPSAEFFTGKKSHLSVYNLAKNRGRKYPKETFHVDNGLLFCTIGSSSSKVCGGQLAP